MWWASRLSGLLSVGRKKGMTLAHLLTFMFLDCLLFSQMGYFGYFSFLAIICDVLHFYFIVKIYTYQPSDSWIISKEGLFFNWLLVR